MSSDGSIVFDDFRTGETGLLGLEKAPSGSFHSKNCIVYANGLLGPRPGLKDFTPDNMPNGLLRMLVESPTPDKECLFAIANTVYYSSFRDISIDPTALTGSLSGYGYAIFPKPDTADFLVAIPAVVAEDGSGGVYRLSQVAGTVTKESDSPPGHELEIYGSQLIVSQERGEGPRLLGSAPRTGATFDDWPSENFIDIGDNWGVNALRSQHNYLAIFKRNGLYVLSGVFGDSTMVVRRVTSQVTADKPWHVDVDDDDRAWFIPLFRENLASFSGASVQQIGYLTGLTPRLNDDADLPLKRGLTILDGQTDANSIVAVQTRGDDPAVAVVRHNSAWTYHEYETDVSGMLRGFQDHYIITDGGAADAPATILLGVFNLDRPAFTTDARSMPGDASTDPLQTTVTFPVWLSPKGGEVRVRSVDVEIIKWDTGVENNSLNCTVTTVNRPNGAGDVENETSEWTEAATSATTDGVHDRITFGMQNAIGQGFQIKFDSLVGVAIKSYTVNLENFNEQPRVK